MTSVNFVLHAHLPWLKRAGKWPFGEEWLYQAILSTYIPLADMLHRLRHSRISGAITLGITPVLIEMLRDPYFMDGFDAYVDSRVALLDDDIVTFGEREPKLRQLAIGARAHVQSMRKHWKNDYGRDLLAAFSEFAKAGEIEILTSAATHAYLPLMPARAVEAQLANGIATTQSALGVRATGVWLPECAFERGIVPLLERLGLKYFYADERALADLTADLDRPLRYPNSGVSYFTRHPLARGELMDTDLGYPGNSWYREFYKRHERSGMHYWRVTDKNASFADKEPYEPARALEQIRRHAGDFVRKIRETPDGQDRFLTFTFDAELFGHWWGEGILWLEETLVQLHHEGVAGFARPSEILASATSVEALELPRSSWGIGGDDRVWNNPNTAAYWDTVQEVQIEFEDLVHRYGQAAPFVQQAARELFLVQSSDWPFLMTNGEAGSYPQERVARHVRAFAEVARAARGETHDAAIVRDALNDDTLFGRVNLDSFSSTVPLS